MTAIEIIEEIKRLPREEQRRVIEFAQQAGASQPHIPEDLGRLAKRMVEAQDPAEADRLQEEIVRGLMELTLSSLLPRYQLQASRAGP